MRQHGMLIETTREEALLGPDAGSPLAGHALELVDSLNALGPESRRTIFAELSTEREHQEKKWGAQNHPVRDSADSFIFKLMRDAARRRCDAHHHAGVGTWFDIALEEFFEAFAEDTPEAQRAEFIHAAAVLVEIIECLDRHTDARGAVADGQAS